MSFGIALTGIDAAQADLNVVSNNIANANTTGFKQSVTEFSDLYASSQNGVAADAIGNGVQVAAVAQDFSQGSLQTTGSNLNLAISGTGFFTVKDSNGLSYTRSGDFSTNSAGAVVNSQGQALQVYAPTGNGGFNTSSTVDLQIGAGDSAPVATQNVDLTLDLPANTLSLNNTTLSNALSTSFSAVSTLFSGSGGVASTLNSDLTSALSSTGAIAATSSTLTAQENALTTRQNTLDDQMNALSASLTQQYSALNTLLSSLETTSSYLTQQFASLPTVQGKSSA